MTVPGESRPLRGPLRRITAGATTVGVLLLGAPAVLPTTTGEGRDRYDVPSSAGPLALAGHRVSHPKRKVKKYRVRRGDTPSAIAVRYHAWTAELIARNGSTLYAGKVIEIPVVVRAARRCTVHRNHRTGFRASRSGGHARPGHHQKPHHHKPKQHHKPKPHKPKQHATHHKKPHGPRKHTRAERGWRHADASRAHIRRVVVRKAGKHGVNPDLALAIAWQESGWQQRRVSPAGAIGVMQVLPSTGRWMALYAGHRLHLHRLHQNITAGVTLIKVLRAQASLEYAVAGYFQGLAGVRQDGMHRSTKHYVADVLALKKRLARGWRPA